MLTVDDFVKIFGVFDVSGFHWDFYSGTTLRLNALLKVSLFRVTCHETSREAGALFTSITECCAYFGTVLISSETPEGVNPQVGIIVLIGKAFSGFTDLNRSCFTKISTPSSSHLKKFRPLSEILHGRAADCGDLKIAGISPKI